MLRLTQSKQYYIGGFIVLANFIVFVLYAFKEESQASLKAVEIGGPPSIRSTPDLITQYDVILPERPNYIPPVVIYNRVPKTGSTTFANIAYALAAPNHFSILHLNTTFKNHHWLNVIDQARFVRNVTEWKARQPAIYHGHMHFLDFTRFGYSNPIYINIVREPLERLVSYYYFLRHGDDYRPHIRRARAHDNTTFDECIRKNGFDCNPKKLWIQIPFFCGQAAACLKPGRWALEQAKFNLISHYLLVGVTDQLEEFVVMLENMLPSYFSGAHQLYSDGDFEHLRKTKGKLPPNEETIELVQASEVYQLESEFYRFAQEQFTFMKDKVFKEDRPERNRFEIHSARFKYEKVMVP